MHDGRDLVEGLEAGEELEVGQGDGDLGFMVAVAEFMGVSGVKFLGEGFVGVDLEGEGFGEGEDLCTWLGGGMR